MSQNPISRFAREVRAYGVAGAAVATMALDAFRTKLKGARVKGTAAETVGAEDAAGALEVSALLREQLHKLSSPRYDRALTAARAAYTGKRSAEMAELAAAFQTKGICSLPVTSPGLGKIRGDLVFDLDMANRHARLDWHGNTIASMSHNLRTQAPTPVQMAETYRILFESPVADLIRSVLGYDFTIYNFRLVQSLPHHDRGQGPQAFHYDGCPPGIVRGLLYLTDVDADSGPFEYLENKESRFATAPAGTFLLFDANRLIHRGNPPKTRRREVMDFVVGPLVPGQKRAVIWSGLNNWPVDPYHFSTDGCLVCDEKQMTPRAA